MRNELRNAAQGLADGNLIRARAALEQTEQIIGS
jgi:hypothetical protein